MFLETFNEWRFKLAADLYGRYPALDINSLNDLAQKVINRIVFTRMCEGQGGSRVRKCSGTSPAKRTWWSSAAFSK